MNYIEKSEKKNDNSYEDVLKERNPKTYDLSKFFQTTFDER